MRRDDLGLGRLVEHDPRSRSFAFAPQASTAEIRTVRWTNWSRRLDQGSIGACTGFTMANWLNSKPAHRLRSRYLGYADALRFYSRATQLDIWDGAYPPIDTGSSGNAACKAAREEGRISGWRWIFEGVQDLKLALLESPVMAGTVWLDGMFDPDSRGFLTVDGDTAGGHEYLIVGWNQTGRYFTLLNSWGAEWGINGFGKLRESDMASLLAARGDLVVPIPL